MNIYINVKVAGFTERAISCKALVHPLALEVPT